MEQAGLDASRRLPRSFPIGLAAFKSQTVGLDFLTLGRLLASGQ